MVLAWVGGARVGVQHGDLGSGTDYGLMGASAELAHEDSLPTGKPIHEATSESSEGSESESEDDSKPVTPPLARTQIESQWFAARAVHEVDATSPMRARLLLASIGARGPPVG